MITHPRKSMFVLGVTAFLFACNGSTPSVFNAKINGQDFYAVKKELTITLTPSSEVALQIDARRDVVVDGAAPAGEIGTGQIVIYLNEVQPGFIGTYSNADGYADIDIDDGNTWSTTYGSGSFSLEITQLDTGKEQASGNFSFIAKKSASDPATLQVADGTFLWIDVDDDRP